jgi:streptomycin 6-kinase
VQLHEAEQLPNVDVLLLERCVPGTPLGHTLPELEQDVIVAGMLRQLWIKPEPGHPFRSLQSVCETWADEAERKFARANSTAYRRLQRDGLALFRELSTPADSDVLLCTDLHGENILAAQRESWLMIDPKPYLGDPAYDPIQHMLNCERRLHNDPIDFVRRMADILELDAERVRLWLFARCVQESAGEPGLIDVAYRLE